VPIIADTVFKVSGSYNSDDSPYAPLFYYNSTATTWKWEQATELPGGKDHNAINLSMLPAKTISGTVRLPSGTASTDIGIYIDASYKLPDNACATYQFGSYSYTSATITAGTSSASYTIKVPEDSSAEWMIHFRTYKLSDTYLREAYYNSTGCTWDRKQATILTSVNNQTGIDLTLITGKTIKGTITLGSACNNSWGCYVYAQAENLNSSEMVMGSYAIIANGATSGTYTIVVPNDATAQWLVTDSMYSNFYGTILPIYYYNGTPTSTWDSALATPLSGGADHSSINMTLPLTCKTISGKVYLPAGKVAPYGMYILVFAVNSADSVGGVSSYMWFSEGKNYASYDMIVPDVTDAQWLVKYENYLYTCADGHTTWKTISEGYYNTTATVGKAQATPLSGSTDHEDINMTLLKTTLFNWNIFLPAMICPKK
jgi:hypothetical protein